MLKSKRVIPSDIHNRVELLKGNMRLKQENNDILIQIQIPIKAR